MVEKLHERVLYPETDSFIYIVRDGEALLETGAYLVTQAGKTVLQAKEITQTLAA